MKQPETETVTARVLKELGSEDGHTLKLVEPNTSAHSGREPEADEELHIDERWLVSYADMMTLLFGLFVMLYAMAGSFEVVKSSAAKRFGGTVQPPHGEAETENLNHLLAAALSDAKTLRTQLKTSLAENTAIQARLAAAETKIGSLATRLTSAQALKAADSRTKPPVAAPPSSLTIVMKWSTVQHDLDLVVKDPEQRVYDFKHRKYEAHPGNLVLDSRHGPGAELWQADRIITGVYEVTAYFYNPYENPEPAQVSISILTAHGTVNLPETRLFFDKNPRQTIRFAAKADGSVQLLK